MPHPLIFETSAVLLLRRLSPQYGHPLTLGSIPAEAWDELGARYDWLWLMGVWQRSDASKECALTDDGLRRAYDHALTGWTPDDVGGSPYAVAAYEVDPSLGSDADLALLREDLRRAGLRLILDFVPNHLARDHRWTLEHPEYFQQACPDTPPDHDGYFTTPAGVRLAHGRDPYFPPWTDTVQLDFTSQAMRDVLIEELLRVAERCDGVRCDMAMLALNEEHRRIWPSDDPGPEREFWDEAIEAVKARHPAFVFIAESYWSRESDLLALGFDYAYDKGLYDALRDGPDAVRAHLQHDRLGASALRFIENHDEERALSALGPERSRAAAVIAATLPGAFLVHDGQPEGRTRRLPVQLHREAEETPDAMLAGWYDALLAAVSRPPIVGGRWSPLTVEDAHEPGDASTILAWLWSDDQAACAVVVNYEDRDAHGRVRITVGGAARENVTDRLAVEAPSAATFVREVELSVSLAPWQASILDVPPGTLDRAAQ